MTNTSSPPPEQEPFPPPYKSFEGVSSDWDLQWLFEAMTQAKRNYCKKESSNVKVKLSDGEWQCLLGVLRGYGPQEMSRLIDVAWQKGSIQQILYLVYRYVKVLVETLNPLEPETDTGINLFNVSPRLRRVHEMREQLRIITATVPLPLALWQSFEEQIRNGRYSSWSEVICEALQNLEEGQGEDST